MNKKQPSIISTTIMNSKKKSTGRDNTDAFTSSNKFMALGINSDSSSESESDDETSKPLQVEQVLNLL